MCITIEEAAVPVNPVVGCLRDAGLDPLYVTNEGKLIVIVPPKSRRCPTAIRKSPYGQNAARIGSVLPDQAASAPR